MEIKHTPSRPIYKHTQHTHAAPTLPFRTLDLPQPPVVRGGRMKCRHKPSILQTQQYNCFQHIPESCGALHSSCGGAPQQRGPLTPQTQTRPNRLHTHTHPPKHLAHPRSPIPPLSTLTSHAAHAHPTSPRSTGLCAIWDCISSSSSSSTREEKLELLLRARRARR